MKRSNWLSIRKKTSENTLSRLTSLHSFCTRTPFEYSKVKRASIGHKTIIISTFYELIRRHKSRIGPMKRPRSTKIGYDWHVGTKGAVTDMTSFLSKTNGSDFRQEPHNTNHNHTKHSQSKETNIFNLNQNNKQHFFISTFER